MKVELRPSIRADFDELLTEPLPCRVRATTAVYDGRVIGIGGLAFLPDGTVAAFVHAVPEARKHKVTLHRAGLMTLKNAAALGIRRIVAVADPDIETAIPWLKRLGFEEMTIGDQQVWVWQTRSP